MAILPDPTYAASYKGSKIHIVRDEAKTPIDISASLCGLYFRHNDLRSSNGTILHRRCDHIKPLPIHPKDMICMCERCLDIHTKREEAQWFGLPNGS